MFCERQDNQVLDPQMGFLNDGAAYDDILTSTTLKEEHWQKLQNLLPTPPCSPEDLCYQTGFPELTAAPTSFQQQQGLQVVPDNVQEELVDANVEPLPVLQLSDEDMQKLTSPTVFDDTMWQQSQTASIVAAPVGPAQHEPYESSKIATDVNYISHGIRTVHISESIMRTPAYSQSFVLTVNANPIQPLNSMGHVITREILLGQNPAMSSDPTFMNERAGLMVPFETTNHGAMPESPSKKGRRLRRMSRNTQESGSTEENADDSEDSETTRATHNVLERKRREELKEKFQRLRDCLPDLQDNDRAPKVLILKKSCEYVKYLEQEEQRLLADKELERQRFFILLNKRHMLSQGIVSM